MDIYEYLKEEAEKWPGATAGYKAEWECHCFYVAEKIFCIYGLNGQQEKVMTVKGTPDENQLLRDTYDFVTPGYYTNKVHWNSFVLEKCTLSKEELCNYLKQSYQLVVEKLPKKVRESL